MSDITACPFCGDPDPAIDESEPGKFALCCNDCGAIGPIGLTPGQVEWLEDIYERHFA